jgi:16S rRNA (uracil1498-N3)-methyltransferase
MHRFFAPALDPGSDTVALPPAESEHLVRVLRLGAGEIVSVFDGRGREYLARVAGRFGREVRLQVLSSIEPATEPAVSLTIVQAVLKGEKMDAVVRDAVMLGAAAVQPIVTRRAETTLSALRAGVRMDRWRRIAIASVTQSRRAVVPDVRAPVTLDRFLEEPAGALRLMLIEPAVFSGVEAVSPGGAEPVATRGVEPVATLRTDPVPRAAEILVGPEGGWDPSEVDMARARGVRLITLGRRTMRADAVAIAAISVLQFLWGDL